MGLFFTIVLDLDFFLENTVMASLSANNVKVMPHLSLYIFFAVKPLRMHHIL